MKSHVSVEQAICLVCGTKHDTGVLLDRRLRNTLEPTTVTHYELCPECKKLYDEGYLALVECDPVKSGNPSGDTMTPKDAWRTGRVAHVRRAAWQSLFNTPELPDASTPMVFVDMGVIDQLLARQEAS